MDNKRHFYLYAKGHYKKTNNISDLKKIIEKITGLYPEYINEEHIHSYLLKEVFKYIKTENSFLKFILDDPFFPKKNLIDKCLSTLRFLKVSDIDIELGKADPNILPLMKG